MKEMNKKIICIGIVSMFLLMSTTISITGKEASVKTNTQNELDLQLTVKNVEPSYDYDSGKFEGYTAYCYIKNVGTTALAKEEYPHLEVRRTAEKDDVITFDRMFNSWSHHEIGDSLEPGEEIGWTIWWWENPLYGYCPPRAFLTVSLDPNNLIPESNDEDNNYWSAYGPRVKSKSVNLLYNQLLQKLLEKLPLLARLLQV